METAVIFFSALSVVLTGTLAFAVYTIRRLKDAEKRSVETDEMSGLPNRDGFMHSGRFALERGREMSLIIFDVEKLGLINTLFGTERGDDVIRAFAAAISAVKRAGDVVGRVNTDDFALLTELDPFEAAELFERELRAVIVDRELSEQVNYFAGICRFDGHDDIYTLYNKANLCLLMHPDGARVSEFTPDMESRMVENELLRSEMLDALRLGQFELYYQPKVSFKTGDILGVEALIRWHHPVKGFIPPCDFIPLAEQFGIITKIDEWGLVTACKQCKQWQDMGLPPVKVSVNMSQAQFDRTDVYASVVRALEVTGLEPRYLEIEVTETMAMTDVERTVNVLGRIHALGVSISMDDFGTGYSSLASLKTIPFDVLKIDRSLVCDLSENDASRRITGAIVAMGKALRMVVLAEGVETNEQRKFLGEIGCDLAQGYYFSKPLPASEIETMLILPVARRTTK
ncbi:MAG: bifunctional diguanylate cyclase/phosphodiesterase [Lachnospiraceae bacterium]|nr:bifunctional diguanylate cyclase/phosphodiesterase [Ruminococcus sp.]MCM1274161.1 bifunctional diguanylate cyclase/phosphodiesterase [Lachnospiraceae bacterium]